jgi:hypothetical protein
MKMRKQVSHYIMLIYLLAHYCPSLLAGPCHTESFPFDPQKVKSDGTRAPLLDDVFSPDEEVKVPHLSCKEVMSR